ncbi:MAG: retropepsin-like aspartic protease [Gemmatimonadota bacterium]|nr:retropepsin-like aspartic protease [Gemmatimonadota bacterium]
MSSLLSARPALAPAALFLIVPACLTADPEQSPASAEPTATVPTTTSGVSVPFRFIRNQIVLEVTVGGRPPLNMLLDTAVNPSAIDLATAEELGLPVDREQSGEASGTGSERRTIYAARITDLEIGGEPFGTVEAVAGNLAPLGERLGAPLHGILGYSFLRDRAVRIDYPGRRVHIYDGAAPASTVEGRFEIPLELDGTDVIVDPVHVDERPLRVTLDTGSSLTLEVYGHAAERIGIGHLRTNADSGEVMGARGTAAILTASVGSIRVGGFEADEAEVVFPERDGDTDGNLGNGFLKSFVLTVDYVSGRLTIEPGAGPDP